MSVRPLLVSPLVVVLLLPGQVLAQAAPSPGTLTPAQVPAPPPEASTPPGGGPFDGPTEPRPGASSSSAPVPAAAPRPEVGLMVSETAFGALTALGTVGLPFALYKFGALDQMSGGNAVIPQILVLLALAGSPLAVSGTQVGIANQSRHYVAEAWPAQLATLGMQAAVVGVFYLAGGFAGPTWQQAFGRPNGELFLLIGSVALVPAAGTVALNLTKQPRGAVPFGGPGALAYTPEGGLRLGVPAPQPLFAAEAARGLAGVLVPLASGRF